MPRLRPFSRPCRLGLVFAAILPVLAVRGESLAWTPPAAPAAVTIELLAPGRLAASAATPVAFYLTGLPFPRVGTVDDATLIAELRAAGFTVAVADFSATISPDSRLADFVPTLVALRADLQSQRLLPGDTIDRNRIFLIPAGCRLLTDVVFYETPQRTLALDLIYPAAPADPVGTVLEFSCDNTDRMGNFSLDFCTDTLLPVAALAGFAAAMADHPVDPPYRGFDPLPESGYRATAAVQSLRAVVATHDLPLNDRIVSAGFSRGSGMALLTAITGDRDTFADHGVVRGPSAAVQGAVVMSGRFTYLDLRPDDPMIPRYEKTWGPRASHETVWRTQGALDHLDPVRPPPPLFLTITPDESPHARHQMDVLRATLQQHHASFVFVPESAPRGHKMPIDPAVTTSLIHYLRDRLTTTH